MKSFVEKYKPQSTKEIPQKLETLLNIIKNGEHAIIYGPTGSCKTISVYNLAKELDYEIIEVNASDFRTKDQIDSIIGAASQQQSLFQKEKILLIDEVDCLSGTEDRGGPTAIANLLKNSNGDLRAALNDLQSNILNKELMINNEQRDYELGVMHILNKIFKTKSFESHKLMENSNITLDEYTLWLDENLPLEYKDNNDLSKAYELISKADIFKGRIRRWQYWRLMYYQSLLLSAGISLSKSNINNSSISYKRSMRPLRIWQLNMKNFKKKSIAGKIASLTHTSIKE